MSWTLGLDTSSIELSIGLAYEGRPVASSCRYLRNSHAEYIAESVEFLLQSNGITPETVERIGLAVGPGSFTGLRIGIAFIKGFCFGRPTRVLPISSLESLALAWPFTKGPIMTFLDARRNQVFWARFERSDAGLKRENEDTLAPVDSLMNIPSNNAIIITDAMGYKQGTMFLPFAGKPGVFAADQIALQRGLACACKASALPKDAAEWTTADRILPRYMSPAYGEAGHPFRS
jgi:tRNA threonylcarbamoyladenosine biosynthesis protein TsaB